MTKEAIGWCLTHLFNASRMEVGKTLNKATLSGGSHVPLLPTLTLSYPPYELPILIGQATTSRTTQEPGWEEHWLASGTRRTVDLAKIIVIEVIDQIPGRARR